MTFLDQIKQLGGSKGLKKKGNGGSGPPRRTLNPAPAPTSEPTSIADALKARFAIRRQGISNSDEPEPAPASRPPPPVDMGADEAGWDDLGGSDDSDLGW